MYIGKMEKRMEATIQGLGISLGCNIGIMEEKMETTTQYTGGILG